MARPHILLSVSGTLKSSSPALNSTQGLKGSSLEKVAQGGTDLSIVQPPHPPNPRAEWGKVESRTFLKSESEGGGRAAMGLWASSPHTMLRLDPWLERESEGRFK